MNKDIQYIIREYQLHQIPEYDILLNEEYIRNEYKDSLNEMAKINVKEFKGYFPYNKFDIRIWSNDHNPPHFHVIGEGWDIVVEIETGDIIKTKKIGKNSKFYSYVKDVVKDWLKSKCAVSPKLTNKENALSIWVQNNPDI